MDAVEGMCTEVGSRSAIVATAAATTLTEAGWDEEEGEGDG